MHQNNLNCFIKKYSKACAFCILQLQLRYIIFYAYNFYIGDVLLECYITVYCGTEVYIVIVWVNIALSEAIWIKINITLKLLSWYLHNFIVYLNCPSRSFTHFQYFGNHCWWYMLPWKPLLVIHVTMETIVSDTCYQHVLVNVLLFIYLVNSPPHIYFSFRYSKDGIGSPFFELLSECKSNYPSFYRNLSVCLFFIKLQIDTCR